MLLRTDSRQELSIGLTGYHCVILKLFNGALSATYVTQYRT